MPDLDLGHTRLIIATARAEALTTRQTAYALATGYWETNRTMQPVEEAYYLGAGADAYRRRLRYYPWYGRGFVQLTWLANYQRASAEIGVDLISDPSAAMDPEAAAKILVIGSRDGWFTGRRLADYINARQTDYVGARRIINGTDCAQQIARIALDYEHALTPAPDYPAIRRGSRGAAVMRAQVIMAALGHSIGAPDGLFGPLTERAVVAVQRANALTPDGIVGPKTWAVLLEHEMED